METAPKQLRLVFENLHKSITEFETTEVPNFTVVTGPNGSGKTHLLEAISVGALAAFTSDNSRIDPVRIMHLPLGSVLPVNVVEHNATAQRQNHWQMAVRLQNEGLVDLKSNILRNALQSLNQEPVRINQIFALTPPEQKEYLIKNVPENALNSLLSELRSVLPQVKSRARQFWNDARNAALTGTVIDELQEDIFFSDFDELSDHLDRVSISSSSLFFDLTVVISTYHREREKNEYYKFKSGGIKTKRYSWLTDEQFHEKFGPEPWILINSLLESMNLGLRIDPPNNDMDDPFRLVFRKDGLLVPMTPFDLSGGERVIIALATALYGSLSGAGPKLFPKLLLLDELDAPLHPSLAKSMLNALQSMLKKTNCSCLLTTHSPSTVAFSPSSSLYELVPQPRALRPISREHGIHILTNGLLAVTESTRFVFTEAKADADIYQAVLGCLTNRGKAKIVPNLIFFPVSDEKDEKGGGKDQVTQWVKKLSESSAISVSGIIDRDRGNNPDNNIFVTERYSLENYLLDPLLIVGFMLGALIKPTFVSLKFERLEAAEIRKLDAASRQIIVDEFTRFIEGKRPELATEYSGSFEVSYLDGFKLNLPVWLRDYRGHDLMKIYKAALHPHTIQENVFSHKYTKLAAVLIQVLPELIPIELSKLILQNQDNLNIQPTLVDEPSPCRDEIETFIEPAPYIDTQHLLDEHSRAGGQSG